MCSRFLAYRTRDGSYVPLPCGASFLGEPPALCSAHKDAPDSIPELKGFYWKITDDYLYDDDPLIAAVADSPSRVGTSGPGYPLADPSLPTPIIFRLKDDDGEVYYEGQAANEASLEYAYEFGRADAGCTNLEVRCEGGRWVSYIS